jgi:hypothetical protein
MKRTSTDISFSDASSTDLSAFFREEEQKLAKHHPEHGNGELWSSQVSVFILDSMLVVFSCEYTSDELTE